MICPLLKRRVMLEGGTTHCQPASVRCGNGADDESTRSDFESDGGKPEMVGGGRDHRGDGSDDAAVAGTLPKEWLRRFVRLPEEAAEPEADCRGETGGGAPVVPGEVFRFQCAAFSREAGRRARHPAELHMGKAGAARSRAGGEAAAARNASATSSPAAVTGNAAAYRCQPACLVSRRPTL